MNDRIKLAEAMGWKAETHDGIWSWFNRSNDKAFCDLPDPFTDANADYAVLEWMRKFEQQDMPEFEDGGAIAWEKFLRVMASRYSAKYRIGDNARAALKVIE